MFPYQTINASRSQVASDNTTNTVFDFSAATGDIVYTLPPIGSLGEANGWMQFIKFLINLASPQFMIILVPSGGDLINGHFNALNPMVIGGNHAGGLLSSDGTQWFYQGKTRFGVQTTPFQASTTYQQSFNTAIVRSDLFPLFIEACALCTTAEGNYAVNDIVSISFGCTNVGGLQSGMSVDISFDVGYFRSPTTPLVNFFAFFNKTTGAQFTPTPANWSLVQFVNYRIFA